MVLVKFIADGPIPSAMAGFLFDPLLSKGQLPLTRGTTSCLFIPALGALADPGRIKERKKGS